MDILPYSDTNVKLKAEKSSKATDQYINANFISSSILEND